MTVDNDNHCLVAFSQPCDYTGIVSFILTFGAKHIHIMTSAETTSGALQNNNANVVILFDIGKLPFHLTKQDRIQCVQFFRPVYRQITYSTVVFPQDTHLFH